jgi:ABC-2 type transport system ATP-binding protein
LPEVSATCSQVAIVNHGRIVATDRLDNLMTQLTRGGYEIEVGGDINGIDAAVQAFLRNVPGVETVEAIAVEDLPEGRYRFQVTIEPGSEPGGAIASAIVESQLDLLEMRRTRASLEDVFLKLTTEDSPSSEPTPIAEPASAAIDL